MIALLLFLAAGDDGSVDQEVRLSLRGDAVSVDYVVQLGRQAAFAEVLQIDADRDGRLTAGEQARYFGKLETSIRTGLELRVDGRDVPLRPAGEPRLEMPFRKIYRFEADRGGGSRVELHNENFPESPGTVSVDLAQADALDVVVDARGRDLVCQVKPGAGKVERRPIDRPAPPEPSKAGMLGRILGLAGLALAALFAVRGRAGAAVATLVAAVGFGAAALAVGRPSAAEAEQIFLALHEEARGDARRVKPLETRIERGWGSEFQARHRWTSYESPHAGHVHAREREGFYRVRWSAGAWRLEELGTSDRGL